MFAHQSTPNISPGVPPGCPGSPSPECVLLPKSRTRNFGEAHSQDDPARKPREPVCSSPVSYRNVDTKTNSFAGFPTTRTWGVVLESASWSPFDGAQQEPDVVTPSGDRRIALPLVLARASPACSSEWDTSHTSACLVRMDTDPGDALRTGARHHTPRKAPRPNRDDRDRRFESSR